MLCALRPALACSASSCTTSQAASSRSWKWSNRSSCRPCLQAHKAVVCAVHTKHSDQSVLEVVEEILMQAVPAVPGTNLVQKVLKNVIRVLHFLCDRALGCWWPPLCSSRLFEVLYYTDNTDHAQPSPAELPGRAATPIPPRYPRPQKGNTLAC